MTAAGEARLWYLQRISAMVLAVCVVIHLAVIVYATRSGLSASELLGRTRGSGAVAAFYSLFVVACAIHVPIGLAAIAREWLGWQGRGAAAALALVALAILLSGLRAVYAVVA